MKFKTLTYLYHPELEVLWVHLRPTRLQRGFPCIVSGTAYHTLYPAGASDAAMVEYLFSLLTTIGGRYPGCGILLTGDFNRLKISGLLTLFKLKQLVRVPTRGDQTLDLTITNMSQFCNKDLIQTFSPSGLSDHFVVLLEPKLRSMRNTCSRRSLTRRDTRPSRKCDPGTYLGSIDSSVLDSVPDCESKLQLFHDLVKIGLDTIMPLKTIKLHIDDAPWVSAEFKALIKSRQKAFTQGDTVRFRHPRNITNRERKLCRGRNYATKVANLKTTVCPCSHFLMAIPTADRSATPAARTLIDNVFLELGLPSTLLGQRSGEFLNAVLREVSRLLSIKQVFTSSCRPRANRVDRAGAPLQVASRGGCNAAAGACRGIMIWHCVVAREWCR